MLQNYSKSRYVTDSLYIHPLINGLFRRPIIYSYSKQSINFSGRSPDSRLCSIALQTRCTTISSASLAPHSAQTPSYTTKSFLRPHRIPQTVRQTCNIGNRGVTHSLTQECVLVKRLFSILHLLISC